MSRSLKIKVVLGPINDSALLHLWEAVASTHNVELYALESSSSKFATTLPVVMFPSIPDMPGFFRDLDKYLQGADLIMGIETSKLYTFQALRAARKLGISFGCVVHEYAPLVYEKYSNIRAIQHDIHQNADVFFPTSHRAAQLLKFEGVPEERISRISMPADVAQFSFDARARNRFRKYVGIPGDCTLISVKADLGDAEPAFTAIQGVRFALSQMTPEHRSKIRILICGDGDGSTKLKYEVCDMGLGAQTMFLSQDTSPFLADLLCATDILIEGRWLRKSEVEPLPWHILGAASCGATIITPAGTISDDWLGKVNVQRVDDFSVMDLACRLSTILSQPSDFEFLQRVLASRLAMELLSPGIAAATLNFKIEMLCTHDEKSIRKEKLTSFIKSHQVPVSFKEASEVLLTCEEIREFASTCENEHHSEILRIRGDALVALARGDEAISAFEQSLKWNQSNFHALRGLGYLAWHGHSHEDALSFFRRGLAIDPNDYQCLVGIGLVYRRLKMFAEAVYWLQKAVSVGGADSPSLSLVVQACLENPEVPAALETLISLRDTVGDHPNLIMAIGKLESHQ